MGKATIVSGGTDGNYTIKMDYGKEVRDGRVTKVNAALAEIGPKITEALGNLNTQEIIEGGAVADVEAAIDEYVAATQAVPLAYQAIDVARINVTMAQATLDNVPAGVAFDIIRDGATADLAAAKASLTATEASYKAAQAALKPAIEKHAKLASALMNEKARTAQKQIVLDLLNEQKKAMETEESDLSGVELEETMEAWCADFTEDGTGEVGTIEIPGENAHVLIVPGAKAHSSADGNLAARELMSPEQVFFNAAILPGWQKFKPTFRRGTITALDTDADTADVTFTDDKSSAQGLDINRYPSLDGIPVTYMTCHAGAFEVGDECVVKFAGGDWSFPKVVGFVTNPKPCLPEVVIDLYLDPEIVNMQPAGSLDIVNIVEDSWGVLNPYTCPLIATTKLFLSGSMQFKARFSGFRNLAGASLSDYAVAIEPGVVSQRDNIYLSGSSAPGTYQEIGSSAGMVGVTQWTVSTKYGDTWCGGGIYELEYTPGSEVVQTMESFLGDIKPQVTVTHKGRGHAYEFDRYSSDNRTDLLIYKPKKAATPG